MPVTRNAESQPHGSRIPRFVQFTRPICLLAFGIAGGALPAQSQIPLDETIFLRAAAAGNLAPIQAWLGALDSADGAPLQDLRAGFDARFTHRTESLSPGSGNRFIDALVAAYRSYWADALLDPDAADGAAVRLEQRLNKLARESASPGDMPAEAAADPFFRVARLAEAAGYGVSVLATPPLQDLILWNTERRVRYRVQLTDGVETAEVAFIDDLPSRGWRDYASLGRSATTGWTGDGVLYCVRDAYDVDSERFRVSFLKHEARHIADLRRFPGIDATALEYRAKLTELAFAGPAAPEMLQRFAFDRNSAGRTAHGRANDRVAHALYREIFGRDAAAPFASGALPDGDRIGSAARRLLERSTEKLEGVP